MKCDISSNLCTLALLTPLAHSTFLKKFIEEKRFTRSNMGSGRELTRVSKYSNYGRNCNVSGRNTIILFVRITPSFSLHVRSNIHSINRTSISIPSSSSSSLRNTFCPMQCNAMQCNVLYLTYYLPSMLLIIYIVLQRDFPFLCRSHIFHKMKRRTCSVSKHKAARSVPSRPALDFRFVFVRLQVYNPVLILRR